MSFTLVGVLGSQILRVAKLMPFLHKEILLPLLFECQGTTSVLQLSITTLKLVKESQRARRLQPTEKAKPMRSTIGETQKNGTKPFQ
jgi:hypothetical protein